MRLKHFTPYIVCIALLAVMLSGCSKQTGKEKVPTDWTDHMAKPDKNPFSFYLTLKSLPKLFPKANTEEITASRRLNNLGYTLRQNSGKSLIVMMGGNLRFNYGEIDSLFAFVESGHQVLLSAENFDEQLLSRLGLGMNGSAFEAGKTKQKVWLRTGGEQFKPFEATIKMATLSGSFRKLELPDIPFYVLGQSNNQSPDCIVYSVGSGKMILHAAPVAFTNYFLLQQKNRQYLNNLFSYISEPVTNVYFIPFSSRSAEFSSFSEILANPAMRTAFYLTLLTLGIYLLFEIKRKQRIIPIIKPVENSSVAFTETIGRLYFNKKKHTNLAEKMAQHFLEYVRSNYYLNTSNLDQEFVRLLSAKSGIDISRTESLVYNIKSLQDGMEASEEFLHTLYTQIQDFYNGA